MLNMASVMIGTEDLSKMVDFYEKVFEKKPDMKDDGYAGWLVGKFFFSLAKHSEVHGKSKEPQRILLNIEANDVKEEFERISKIEGIEVIKAPYQMGEEGNMAWIATLADPDGNYFQLMTPWEDMQKN